MTEITPAAMIAMTVGKTIASIQHEEVETHLSYGGDKVTMTFTDGTSLIIQAQWCNDGTAALTYHAPTEV